jgi:hypothetical protein
MNGSYSNWTIMAIENGSVRNIANPAPRYQANTHYEVKVVLKGAGADYFIRGGQYSDWTLLYQSSTTYANDQSLRLSLLHYATNVTIHSVKVFHASGSESAVSGLATPVSFSGVFENTWVAIPSDPVSTTTDDIFTPVNLIVTSIENGSVNLTWADSNTDASGYTIESCCGASCSFGEIGTVGPDVFSFADLSAPDNSDCTYQVMAYKDAGTCSWTSSAVQSVQVSTPPPAPTGFSAAPVNSFKIDLNWDDVAGEDAYEIEVQVWNGAWMPVATLLADTTAYTDTSCINPGTYYTYRIRSKKGNVWSAYEITSTTSSPYTLKDGTCTPQ